MRRMMVGGAVLVVSMAALSACSDDGGSVSADEWRDEVDSLCEDAEEAFGSIELPDTSDFDTDDPDDAEAALEQLSDAVQPLEDAREVFSGLQGDIEDLGDPEGLESEAEDLVDAFQQFDDAFGEVLEFAEEAENLLEDGIDEDDVDEAEDIVEGAEDVQANVDDAGAALEEAAAEADVCA